MKKWFSFVSIILLISTSVVFADSGIEAGTTPTATATPGINDSSKQSSSGNGLAQAVNYIAGGSEVVMGGYMIKTGSSTDNGSLIAMGVMMVSMGLTNIAQGSDHGSAAGSADNTGFQTDGFGALSSTDGTSTTDPYVAAALTDPNYQAVGPTLKALEASGVYNPKTGSFSVDGTTYAKSDLSSAAAMASAGIPQGAIDGAMAANAEAEKKALAKLDKVKIVSKENGYEEGSGSGGASAVASSSDDASSSEGSVSKVAKKISGVDSAARSVAGLSKNFNGESIGVAGDNIFSMVSRRYKLKDSQESFIKP